MAAQTVNACSFVSYNVKGYSPDKIPYLNSLFNQCDFLLIQEHWLYQAHIGQICRDLPNSMVHGCSGMDDSQIRSGRPYGGCAIISSG